MPPVALDVHLPIALAEALAREGVDVVHMSHWHEGSLRTEDDDVLLAAATAAGRTLITRDSRTFPNLAYRWIDSGLNHAGLIILPKSINQDDIGGALNAVLHTIRGVTSDSLANVVTYARRQRRSPR